MYGCFCCLSDEGGVKFWCVGVRVFWCVLGVFVL